MVDTPYLPRQFATLDAEISSAANPVCILVYDGQRVGPLIEHLCGRSGEYERLADGVAWFRVSNYLPTGNNLVKRITDAAQAADWVFVHLGCHILPESILHLMKFIACQNAEKPRLLIVGEQTDVIHGNDAMLELFERVGSFINLRLKS